MSEITYAIFGDADASPKLVKSALTDQLEMHDAVGDTMRLALYYDPVSAEPPIYDEIVKWADDQEVPRDLHDSPLGAVKVSDVVYGLFGVEEPFETVTVAIQYAADNGIEIRDLSEAGLTYVSFADRQPQTKENIGMADESTMTIAEAGAAADEGNEEAIEALMEAAVELGLDPDDYPDSWSSLADAIEAALPEDDEEEEAAPEPEPEAEEASSGVLTREELEAMDVKPLRHLAKQLDVDGWDRLRTPGLIAGILASQESQPEEAAVEETPADDGYEKSKEAGRTDPGPQQDVLAVLARAFRAAAIILEEG